MNTNDKAYQAALDYLYSFVDYSLTRNFRFSPELFDLSRMTHFLGLLGEPHRAYPVVHVAGTKGKGSTSALIASGLRAQGYRVGLYTSPHLQEFTERIQVGGQPILPEELVALVEHIKPFVPLVEHLTTFEITTALGFLYFARQKVDAAVVEVGLGGRLDATNVVDPLVSVITSLSLDHMAVLGGTLEKIAYEKGGIIKPGRPVILAPQVEEARWVIQAVADERGSPLTQVSQAYQFSLLGYSLDGQEFEVRGEQNEGAPVVLRIPLLGRHQVDNAVTAYAALQAAGSFGLPVSQQAIQDGFASVRWPCRFEVLQRSPAIIIDSAHNRDSAARLRQALADYLPGRPVTLIFGASEDKDIEGMFAELLPAVSSVVFTQSIHPRAISPARLVELAAPYNVRTVQSATVEDALPLAVAEAHRAGGAVLVAGSLFIAAAIREVWSRKYAGPAAFGGSAENRVE